jgi:hypothetical protein
MKRDIDFIRSYERDLIEKDLKRNELYNSIWRMTHLVWDFADEHKAKMKNVRTLVDASPADAVHNAAIALSNTIPRWDVPPYGSSLYDYQRTEKMEHCIDWCFRKMNQRGVGTLLFDKMMSSLQYDMIATRIDDLEFQFKGVKTLSPLQKRARSLGRFIGEVFDARVIHIESTMGTFACVLRVENQRAWDVYNYWKLYENNSTPEGAMVAAALRKMEDKFAGKNAKQTREMRFISFEFYNDDQIMKHGYFTSETQTVEAMDAGSFATSNSDIVFADEENRLGFIPWSIRIGGSRMERSPEYAVNPMLAPLHWGNTWETLNVVRSLVMSEPIKRMFEAHQYQETTDGQRLPESNDGVIVGRRGDGVTNLPAAQLDPNTLNVVQALQQELTRTTGANVLSDVTSAKTTPFATLNAMIQVAMSRLDVNRRDGALSCADDALLMLRWVEKTGKPLMSYRQKNKTMNVQGYMMQMMRGEQVAVTADDFDTEQCEINVEIKPKTPTDWQQQIMSAIQLHDKMQVPLEYLLETLGIENVELLRNQYEDELFHNAEVQAAVQNIALQEAQRAQAQAQGQQQPQEPMAQMPSAAGGISQSAMGALNGLGQGINPAMAGSSPQGFMPGMTREMVSGMTQGGESIAAGG